MKIVSFYSDPEPGVTFYSDSAKRMISDCKRLGLDYYIQHRDYGKDWIANVRAKPTFLLEAYDTLKEPFLWVDIDCKISQVPVIPKTDCDMASVASSSNYTICDAVHYIGNTVTTRKLLVEWQKRCGACKTGGSHSILNKILVTKAIPELKFKFLPKTFIKGPVITIGLSSVKSKSNYFKGKSGS